MFSTICLLFLTGFLFWMNTSKRIFWPEKGAIMAKMAINPYYGKSLATVLFLVATMLCVVLFGWGSGLFAATVILMTAGSVSVLFFPFQYVGTKGMATIYIGALALELLTH